jgi:predicted RNA-binding Zn-ribbon protein involved in translation (DUF1610 family)
LACCTIIGGRFRKKLPALHISAIEMRENPRVQWRCPACGIEIQHYENVPRSAGTYRCPTCRLDLVFDATTNRLTLAPLPPDWTPGFSPAKAVLRERRSDVIVDRRQERRGGRRATDRIA